LDVLRAPYALADRPLDKYRIGDVERVPVAVGFAQLLRIVALLVVARAVPGGAGCGVAVGLSGKGSLPRRPRDPAISGGGVTLDLVFGSEGIQR
jgi:hypothetical protein